MKDRDKSLLYSLTTKAFCQMPGSKKQKETIKKLNKERKLHNLKPLKE